LNKIEQLSKTNSKNTTRKSININGNTKGIFSSVNFWGILPMEIFPRYTPRELPWEKKLKQRKKMMMCHFYQRNYQRNLFCWSVGKSVGKLWTLFIMSIKNGITDEIFHRYFPESSRTVHFPIVLLIVVFYRKNHRRIKKSSVLFDGFLKNSINLKFSFKYYRRNHRRIEKSSVIVGSFQKLFTKLKI
jgi:hypothetical protein